MSSGRIINRVVRKVFGRRTDDVPVPNLIEIQSKSFNDFVQLDYLPSEREKIGFQKVLTDIFPISYDEKMSLEFVSYALGSWTCTCGKLTGIENRYAWVDVKSKKTGVSRLTDAQKKTARYKTCPNCLARVGLKLPMTVAECQTSGQSFQLPLKIRVQLVTWDGEGDKRVIRDIKEQEVFFADVPVMADLYEVDGRYKLGSDGTFVINGIERVVVSQLHRSPGVVFSRSKKVKDFRGRPYYLGRIIPMLGSWIDFEFDSNDHLYVRIDKKKKVLVTTFLQAFGVPRDEIISLFYKFDIVYFEKGEFYRKLNESVIGIRIEQGMVPEEISKKYVGRRINKEILNELKAEKISQLSLRKASLINKVVAKDVIDPATGEIFVEQGQSLTEDLLDLIVKNKAIVIELVASPGYVLQPVIALTLSQDHCSTRDEALKEIHAKIWPGDSLSYNEVAERLEATFFSSKFYDITKVGRIRMNRKLGLNIPDDVMTLTREDIFATIKYLVNLRERGEGELDDIDHLGNRRVRLVGELLSNQVYIGFSRIERIVRERFRIQEMHAALMPQDLLNVKPLSAVLREFFGTGQLSQFMDQTNPLSEVAHKRRLSALGPGGVMKDRATYEIRDVHTSHYGRICPIETPEGQTIGLISSLATYAMVNDLGFIETAYRSVKNGKIQDDVVFLDAFQESERFIAQVEAKELNSDTVKKGVVLARYDGNFMYTDSENVEYIDLSPKQLVSVASALIPFLEHDDASRALMGSNMQRQAVPLIKCRNPLVGTGIEGAVTTATNAVLRAKNSGVVEYVSSEKIIVRADESSFGTSDTWIADGIEIYHLKKFRRSSYSTWIHQTPIVKVGERIAKGSVLTNGASVRDGELALGTNLLVAFMPWYGYNFEDAIVLSKRLVADDSLTSVHIDEYSVDARDTKLGPEEITRDIPNVGEGALSALDEDGIVRTGTRVKPGDILVGKVTLKGDVQYSPEEKLLRAIFGEKSREVRDTSLRVPPGVEGTVINVKIFSRSGIRKDKRYRDEVVKEIEKLDQEYTAHQAFLSQMVKGKLIELLVPVAAKATAASKPFIKGNKFDAAKLADATIEQIGALKTDDESVNEAIADLYGSFDNQLRILAGLKEERIANFKKGDPLPSGVIKMVKVYIASRRHIAVGDKLAGRHGNKGVVSIIVPREDMPYLDNGTPVDIVLSPLGVPSRMNVGQILETMLGWAGTEIGTRVQQALDDGYDHVKKMLIKYYGKDLIASYEGSYGQDGLTELARKTAQTGVHFATPVFDGARFNEDIKPLLEDLNLPESGAVKLRDGRTGEYFDQPVTIGSIYMMKLNHMVDDKLHARSVGPYSLVTQQPLGGKAQFGGQRFGEMEVWALEAYGAAYTLQEMLTFKSDDVTGRHRVYESIVRGEDVPEPGLPESFNVLIKELQSLGLQVDLFKSGKEEVGE